MDFETFDASYVQRLRAQDVATEQHFVRYFSELIMLKARSRLRTPEAVEDVKQETLFRALSIVRSDGGVRHAERLGALVNSICNNVLMEQYRKSDRIEGWDRAAAERLAETRPDAFALMVDADTKAIVRGVLGDLKERDRYLLRAVFLEEREKDEICREMGVEREYLRVLLHRAKAAFRARYDQRSAVAQTGAPR